MTPAQQRQLQHLYESAVYEVDLADGFQEILLGPNPGLDAPPFAIITAHNPGLARPSRAENETANARLESRLRADGYHIATAHSHSPDGGHTEPSFAVFNISLADALVIASDFGQAAIVVWDGAAGSIVWTAAPD